MSRIYKILPRADWTAAHEAGRYEGSPLDRQDGFIHFSTAAQAPETARRHFHGQPDLVLVRIDAARLGGALKWEPSRGGELFPHLYAALPLAAVRWTKPVPDEVSGRRVLPEFAP